jgi:hypothetical protein
MRSTYSHSLFVSVSIFSLSSVAMVPCFTAHTVSGAPTASTMVTTTPASAIQSPLASARVVVVPVSIMWSCSAPW